jgi:hypothetical protein
MVMSLFDKWFAKKSKFVWDECKKEGYSLPPSKAEFDYLKSRIQDLEVEMHKVRFDSQTGAVNRRMDMLEAFLNIEVDDKPKYRKKEDFEVW